MPVRAPGGAGGRPDRRRGRQIDEFLLQIVRLGV